MSRPATGWRLWLITLAAALSVAATLALGAWQLSRAEGKRALQAQIDAQRQLPALEASALSSGAPLHRLVTVRGTWLAQHTVFLDNRQMQGRPGFFVLTPLRIEGGDRTVVVQRGWVPRNFTDRNALPAVPTPDGVVSVTGRIAPPPARLYEFAGAQTGPIRQNLDLATFAAELKRPLLDLTVVQTGGADDGLQRQWGEPATGVEKHLGYAFQWFGLAALITILYVWFQIVRRVHAQHRPAR